MIIMEQLQHLFDKLSNAHGIPDSEGSVKDIIEEVGLKGARTSASDLSLWVVA